MTVDDKADLEGIGGWLALLAFAQVIGIVRLIFSLLQQFQLYGQLFGLPGGYAAVILETVLNLAVLALAFATTFALFTKKRAFIKLFFYQWIAIPVVFVLDLIIVAVTLDVPMNMLTDSGDAKIVSTFLAVGIWVWYTRKSKRVANTMVN
ncbi:MAG: hypothetical protein H6Q99_1819 [Proteobacteria bacterium]|nr:hypothetical protein [Pseudomonadota bacterium]